MIDKFTVSEYGKNYTDIVAKQSFWPCEYLRRCISENDRFESENTAQDRELINNDSEAL